MMMKVPQLPQDQIKLLQVPLNSVNQLRPVPLNPVNQLRLVPLTPVNQLCLVPINLVSQLCLDPLVLVSQLENVCFKVDVYLMRRGRDVISAIER